jgi:pyruvate/2-oxoglutarate dehydrogenase complex dihydrolipoamide dehydrogenase (E3) component
MPRGRFVAPKAHEVTRSGEAVAANPIESLHIACLTDRALAHVGLSKGDADRQAVLTRVAMLPVNSVLGAQATEERKGFMKALVSDNDDRILGFTMVGRRAGEVMAAVHTATLARLSHSVLADTAFAHPMIAERLVLLVSNVPSRCG